MSELYDLLSKIKKVHMIGIGGSSMNGIAEIIMGYGIRVSGSDRSASDNTRRLEARGAVIHYGHDAANVPADCDLVVYTLAIADDNPEYLRAKELGIPTVERGVFLGYVTGQHRFSLAVSGTHGKTTTTSMAAAILIDAGKDPCVHMGGYFPMIGGSVRASTSEYFVTEACEYYKNLLNLSPFAGIILNVEAEHLDYYKGGLPEIIDTFSAFAARLDPKGFLVVCADNANAMKAAGAANCRVLTYSAQSASASFHAEDINILPDGTSTFKIFAGNTMVTSVHLSVPGIHNVSNALAAAAACMQFGCTSEDIARGLSAFHGADRRFQVVGRVNGAMLVDDYAHHPTEIKATVGTALSMAGERGRVWSVFQPHTYSRAKFFGDDFMEALRGSAKVLVADIYAAREKDPGDINSSMLADRFRSGGLDAEYFPSFEEIKAFIRKNAVPGDIVLSLGAGDVNRIVIDLAGR